MLISLHCADQVARVDPLTLTDQTLMELLVGPMIPGNESFFKKGRMHNLIILDSEGEFLNVCDWSGVTCDTAANVTEIQWYCKSPIRGTFCLDLLPKQLRNLRIIQRDVLRGLTGHFDTVALPRRLVEVSVYCNGFFGSFDCGGLPPQLEKCDVTKNAMTGSLELDTLPPSLHGVFFSNNQFSGEISLENLPASLRLLALDRNDFSGSLHLGNLPASLEHLLLGYNSFSGELKLDGLPESLQCLDVTANDLTGTVDFQPVQPTLTVEVSMNAFTGGKNVDRLGTVRAGFFHQEYLMKNSVE